MESAQRFSNVSINRDYLLRKFELRDIYERELLPFLRSAK
jgi:hypothetical protein